MLCFKILAFRSTRTENKFTALLVQDEKFAIGDVYYLVSLVHGLACGRRDIFIAEGLT